MNKRIALYEDIGTIRYEGPLMHKTSDPSDIWLGIEWDQAIRGKHSGTVQNYTYFQTQIEGGGSLVRKNKVDFGQDIITSLQKRYFKNNNAWLEALQKLESQNQVQETISTMEKEETYKKDLNIEMDEDAYFKTVRNQKIQVEFYGFLDIWKKINNLQNLQHLSLCNQSVSSLKYDKLSLLLPNLIELSLENNLLYSWQQIDDMIPHFQNLQILSLSGNRLCFEGFECRNIFLQIKRIIMVNMNLSFDNLTKILPLFKKAQEMVLCNNKLNDIDNFNPQNFMENILFLNLEQNEIENFQILDENFLNLPNLEKLTLSQNKLRQIQITKNNYPKLNSISLDQNLFMDFKFLDVISILPILHLRNKLNPVDQIFTKQYVFQRSIAQIGTLQFLNGVEITKHERKDCEYFYLRDIFHQYFIKEHTDHINYNEQDFFNKAIKEHIRLDYLIKKHGNPYEKNDPNLIQAHEQDLKYQKESEKLIILFIECPGKIGKKMIQKKFPFNSSCQQLLKISSIVSGIKSNFLILKKNDECLQFNDESLHQIGLKSGDTIQCFSL